LVLADRHQLDRDVGLLLKAIDNRLGGPDPVGVVLGGPEREAGASALVSIPAATADGGEDDDAKQGNDQPPCPHGRSFVARHTLGA
jgi:hypothetical protein